MNSITALDASGRIARTFSVSEFMDFGGCYRIDHHFPQLAQRPDLPSGSPVLQGGIEEMTLPYGMCVTHSDVQVLQLYETTSRHDSPLYILVVLEGCVILTFSRQEHVVRSGMAFSSCLSEHQTVHARHHADCKLRTLSLGLYPGGACRTGLLESLVRKRERCQTPTLIWQVPGFLFGGLQYTRRSTINRISRQLMLEGLILQLFGHDLSVCQVKSGKRLAASDEQQRLEVVHQLLEQSPEKDYTLNELAQRAAMSPDSLRSRFRTVYGCSISGYLRDCRLERARDYLLERYNVQRAAWVSGYQHATSFSTAFRRRYGFSPGNLLKLY